MIVEPQRLHSLSESWSARVHPSLSPVFCFCRTHKHAHTRACARTRARTPVTESPLAPTLGSCLAFPTQPWKTPREECAGRRLPPTSPALPEQRVERRNKGDVAERQGGGKTLGKCYNLVFVFFFNQKQSRFTNKG